ncbi:MAG: hypothetical protein QQW96_22500 [Tychonema bourrellyi B0820]|nr:hypothetical protein [Tychonema bourrellyi B0820]
MEIGNWAWGIGHGASGIGNWASVAPLPFSPSPLSPPLPLLQIEVIHASS